MQINIHKDYHALSLHAADVILATVKNNPTAILCFATGDTPRLTYQLMSKKAHDEKVDFNGCSFIALDEWVGIPPENEGSCHFALKSLLIDPLNTRSSQVYLFDGMSEDLAAECRRMDDTIKAKGGIDLMLVGVGMNGHIGFNEPGVPAELYTHVANLDGITLAVGQKYFARRTALTQGITLGLKHVLESKKLVIMASGIKKAAEKALEEEISEQMPASILRNHSNALVMIDEEAASQLNKDHH